MFADIYCLLATQTSDIEVNPGPNPKYPCFKEVTWNETGFLCDSCSTWYHCDCQGLGDKIYDFLSISSFSWFYTMCWSHISSLTWQFRLPVKFHPPWACPWWSPTYKHSHHGYPKWALPTNSEKMRKEKDHSNYSPKKDSLFSILSVALSITKFLNCIKLLIRSNQI